MLKIDSIKIRLIIILELFVLGLIIVLVVNTKLKGDDARDMGVSAQDLESDYIQYSSGWHIEPEDIKDVDFSDKVTVLKGPYRTLPAGSYTLYVTYNCADQQEIILYSEDGDAEEEKNNISIKANPIPLESQKETLSYDFLTKEDITNFEIRVNYNGKEAFDIYSIEIKKNLILFKKLFFCLLIIFVSLDIFLLKRDYFYKSRITIFSLGFIVLLASIPLFLPGINKGQDLTYHLIRIDALYDELCRGIFPVKIQSVWLKQMGYAVSIFRGDILLYIAVIFRYIGFSIIESYKMYIVTINILTVVVSFFSFFTLFGNKTVAFIATLGYVTSTYRFLDIYIRAAVDEYTAMLFLPALVATVYLILSDKNTGKTTMLLYASLFAVSMSGVILSHTLSIEMVGIILFIVFVFNIGRAIKPEVIGSFFIAAIESTLLTIFFIVPFIDYYINVPLEVTNGFRNGTIKIQQKGMFVAQLLAFFQNPYGHMGGSAAHRMALTPGLLLMMGMFIGILLCIYGTEKNIIKELLLLCILILFFASDLFPWNFLSSNFQLFNTLSAMEFPWRFLSPACALLSFLLGFVLLELFELYKNSRILIIVICVFASTIGCVVFYGQYIDGIKSVYYYDSPEIYQYANDNLDDFLRVNPEGEIMDFASSEGAMENVSGGIIERDGNSITVICTTGNEGGVVTAPIYNYKGYRAGDASGNTFDIYDDKYCRVCFDLPPNYSDIVTIKFMEPWYWRMAEFISLLFWVVILLFLGHGLILKILCK